MFVGLSELLTLFLSLVMFPILFSVVLFNGSFEIPIHWWVGFLLIGLLATVFHALKVAPSIYMAIIIALILVLSLWKRQAFIQQLLRARELFRDISLLLVVIFVCLLTFAALLRVSTQPLFLGSDTFSIWLNKTKEIYLGKPYPAVAISSYPNLVPTFQAFVLRFVGRYEPIFALYFGPVSYCFWVLGFLSLFKQKSGWVMVIAMCSIAILAFDDFVINGYQDKIILMCASLSALAYLQFFTEFSLIKKQDGIKKSSQLFWLGTFFAGMLCLIKNEGIVMGMLLASLSVFIAYLYNPRQMGVFLRKNYMALPMFIALASLWPLTLYFGNADLTKIQGDSFTLEALFNAPKNIARISVIGPYFLNYFRGAILILFLSIILTLFTFWKAPQIRLTLVYLWAIGFIHSIFILLVFLSTRNVLSWHLATAFDRLMYQHSFIYIIIILFTISSLLNQSDGQNNRMFLRRFVKILIEEA